MLSISKGQGSIPTVLYRLVPLWRFMWRHSEKRLMLVKFVSWLVRRQCLDWSFSIISVFAREGEMPAWGGKIQSRVIVTESHFTNT